MYLAGLHNSVVIIEARGRKTFSRVRPTGATPWLLAAQDNRRKSFHMINRAATVVYIGGDDVTVTTGIPVNGGGEFEDRDSFDAWYAITDGVLGDVVVCTVRIES